MKRLLLLLTLVLCTATAAFAQFDKGTKYVNLSLSGLSLNYSKAADVRFGLEAEAGYYVQDCWLIKANSGYDHTKSTDDFFIGSGFRYNFRQNGIFLGAGLEYEFQNFAGSHVNNLRLPMEIGYTFYLNHYLALEPAVYYKPSFNNFSDGSEVGLRIGFGFYFDRLHFMPKY